MLRYVLVKFGAAGSLQRIGRVLFGTERWGMAVKARSVQEGKREIRTGAIRTGSQGSVLSLWDRCVLVGHGRKFAEDWKGNNWHGKMGFGSRGV
jgi:hypothetical protein